MSHRLGLLMAVVGVSQLAACGSEPDPGGEQRGPLPRSALNWGKADGTGCTGQCGAKSAAGCWCDDKCAQFGDCCADKTHVCDGKQPSCQGHCRSKSPDGCYCDAECAKYGDCCPDKLQVCAGPVDPCAGVTCDQPPVPLCANPSTLRTFAPLGQCSAGTCAYASTDTACLAGCENGACKTAQDPFQQNLCNSGPLMDKAAAIAFIGAGMATKEVGRTLIYRRTRPCHPVTGCGAWGSPALASNEKALAVMAAIVVPNVGGDFELRFSEGPFNGRNLTLGWSDEPYADGQVNGCRWGSGLGGADSYCSLYVRKNCVKFVSIYVDGSTEYAGYWSW